MPFDLRACGEGRRVVQDRGGDVASRHQDPGARTCDRPRGRSARPMIVRGVLATVAAAVLLAPRPAAQQSVFRSSVDLIAIDAQVIGPSGVPVHGLRPDQFTVTLNGKTRRVGSADLVRYDVPAVIGDEPRADSMRVGGGVTNAPGRVFEIAVDTASFDTQAWQRSAGAVHAFLSRLAPDDQVGLYAYPFGPAIAPTRDRGVIARAVAQLIGNYRP